jgi:hypothetical protein
VANQNKKGYRIIALERAEEVEVICKKCKIGIMNYIDNKSLKCTNCGHYINEK